MSVPKHVDWCSGKEDFERIVEALVQRLWSTKCDNEAFAIDGRGGDGGLDIFVERDGVVVSIYQLKFFPEGMSGGFRKTRRDQVKRSFSSVCDTPGLEEWVLVLPRNPTNSELRFVRALGKNSDFQIRVWARAELDQRIAEFPDLLAWATRNPLVETLREAGMQSAALAGPNDLQDRVSALHSSANSRSAFWGTNFSMVDGVLTQWLVAKRPDAPEKEPISVGFTAAFAPEQESLRKQFEEFLDYGGPHRIQLPPEVVGVVKTEGPDWIAGEATGRSIELIPARLDVTTACELQVVGQTGGLLASVDGKVQKVTQGQRGFTLTASFPAMELEIKHPTDKVTAGTLMLRTTPDPVSATATLRSARVQTLIRDGEEIRLQVGGQQALRVPAGTLRGTEQIAVHPGTLALLEDLAFLEREYEVSFTVPEEVRTMELIDIRVVRMLTEGQVTTWPRLSSLSATSTREIGEESLAEESKPRPVVACFEDVVVPILGKPLMVGRVSLYHPSMQMQDVDRVRAAIRSNGGVGHTVTFSPTDETPIRIWCQDRQTDADKRIEPEPWEIPGVSEVPALAQLPVRAGKQPTHEGS